MSTREAREKDADEGLSAVFRRAAQTHERALLVELWAAEHFLRRGDIEAAQRHRDAAERLGTFAENYYERLSGAANPAVVAAGQAGAATDAATATASGEGHAGSSSQDPSGSR